MIIMFIFMFAPLIAIPVFWLLPLGQAIIVYLVSILMSASMFWLMRRTRKTRVSTGVESLMGRDTQVVVSSGREKPTYTVRVEGELWTAESSDRLRPGETAVIVGRKGSRLIVGHKEGGRLP